MKQIIDHQYDRRTSPFLALTRGRFEFLHTSNTRNQGVACRQLSIAPLGELRLPSGKLLAGDPFSGLHHENNAWFEVPAGTHDVFLTLAATGEGGVFSPGQRAAYVSVVFDPKALSERQDAQRARLLQHQDPAVPFASLQALEVCLPDFMFSEAETKGRKKAGVEIFSGSVGLTDCVAFERLMPPNIPAQGLGWLERYFDHDLPGSWFDAMDNDGITPTGSANVTLPDGEGDNIVVTSTGWGDGRYQAWMETGPGGEPVAFHIDFQVIPFDTMGAPVGSESARFD